MTIRNLEYALEPKSVALIGASERPGSVGLTVMRNLRAGGFAGPIWMVNPKHRRLDGTDCYPDVAALPGTPDLAVIATPAATVPGIVAELGRKGTRAAVVLSAGVGRENGLRQAMLSASQPSLLRVIGPNCLGILVPKIGLNASFAHIVPKPGHLALLSQSGAVISAAIDWAAARDIGFSTVVSLGDMADVDVGDMLDYLGGDPNTTAILMYLETITNARKFLSAARSAARAKPVVVIKAGRNEAAAKAAATHTGALSGNDRVVEAAFKRAGLLRVDGLAELFDAAETLTRLGRVHGDRLAILTNGGGAGVLAVEALMLLDGKLAEIAPETMAKLDAALPKTWSRGNPVDVIGDAGPERYEAALAALLDDRGTDAVLVMNCPTALASSSEAAEAVIGVVEARKRPQRGTKPVLTNWLGESTARGARKLFAEAGIATYEFPNDAVRSFSYLTGYNKAQDALMRTPPSLPDAFEADPKAARAAMAAAESAGRAVLTEPEAKAVLAAYGIATAETRIARDAAEVEKIAAQLLAKGSRVVVKLLSEEISHKSDVGGVVLNLESAAAAAKAAQEIAARVAQQRPEARIQGFTVQEMVRRPGAHELIVGVSEDPIFGPTILFGAGGTAVEVIKDTAVALPPLDLALAKGLIGETRVSKLLKGYRDRPAADLDAVAMVLVRISQLITDLPAVAELDINPLLADERGVVALDARIKVDWAHAQVPAPNPYFAIRPYPNGWERTETLGNGRSVLLRPIRPEDEGIYGDFLRSISPADLRLRFFSVKNEFPHQFVARFTQIDYSRAMAFIAVDPASGAMLGGSRLIADPDYVKGEYAVMVRSDLKGQGLGWALMQHLIAYAKAEGLQQLHGDVLVENTHMLSMCRSLGFNVNCATDDPMLCKVTLPLAG
ncbi:MULTISPECIES: bifunctional acetate--CoA ligase family protein/GNAT family N-acetyltransferase [Rhodomicrobium]|uniref:bifunctional acetate--CoA ligase family protein/GNAT family N-acetyltransferase n=1 Tax=Rhodomicrobium TaxID=1068 RepID=UPI000B4ACF4D|nr:MULTISPECIES: bifunctional acetate--CoA ligase family protein/GNAT family N-acetyltransferase [Rhodomicrobium]